MDPRTWVDQLYTYGPYAILALFVFYVAPRQLAAYRTRGGDRAQQALAGTIALGCWAVVFLMVFYVFRYWPPRTVYLGSLGTHPAEAQFFPLSEHLYVSSRPAGGAGAANRLRWDYVVVTDTGALASGETYTFTYQWGPSEQEYADFALPATLLNKRRLDLSPDPEHRGKLLFREEGEGAAFRPFPPIATAAVTTRPRVEGGLLLITAAHAQAPPKVDKAVLLEWLASPNANLRAQGRAQLRLLSVEELRALLATAGLAGTAREQIEAELKRRK